MSQKYLSTSNNQRWDLVVHCFWSKDVAKSLGYINAKDAVKRHVDDDDSMLLQVSDNQWGVKRSILKTRYIDSIRIINESGLYSLR